MVKHEQKFLTAFRKRWLENNVGGFWFKIPDAPTKHQVAKPFDAFAMFNGTFFAFEAKSIKGSAPLKISDLRQSQLDGLSRAAKNGASCFVVVYYPDHKDYMAVPFNFLLAFNEAQRSEFPMEKISI